MTINNLINSQQMRHFDNFVETTCPEPTPSNGQIQPSGSGPYPINTTISFSCNRGYNLDGSDSSTCNIYGIWDPPVPKCKQGNEKYRLGIFLFISIYLSRFSKMKWFYLKIMHRLMSSEIFRFL